MKRILESGSGSEDGPVVPDLPIFEMDLEGNFTSVPESMESITGFSIEELYLLSLQNVVFVEDRPRVIEMIHRIISGSRIVTGEIEIFSEKMGSHSVELIMLPICKDDAISGIWGAIKDMEVGNESDERSRSIRDVQESSKEFLRDFVSLIAREIRQPMTTILLTLEMLDSGFFGDVNDDQKEKIDQMITLVDRMKTVIKNALETSKNIGEEIELDRKMVSLNNVIDDVLKEWKNGIEGKKITVTGEYHKSSTTVPADRKMMFQVINSLVENSVDLSPEGGHIIIGLDRKEDTLQFSIADSGNGLHEREVETIFDKLHVDQDIQKGSFKDGVNLYMAKKVVESHGGRIWCESFEGLGSTFLFTIPLRKEDLTDSV